MLASWAELTDGLDAADLGLLETYREFCRGLPEAKEEIHSAQLQYRRKRIFSSGYIKSHYLEIGLELLREAEHPMLRTAFATSKRVTMHRITLRSADQFDDALRELLTEACETVGPGLR